jgi:hypothetical protein
VTNRLSASNAPKGSRKTTPERGLRIFAATDRYRTKTKKETGGERGGRRVDTKETGH